MIWLRRAVLTVVALSVLALLAWAFMPKAVLVETAVVSRGPLTVSIDADAKTRVRDRFVLSAPLAGRIDRIAMKAGDAVKEGDVLTVLYALPPALLDMRMRKQAQAAVSIAEAQWQQAQARHNAARAGVEYAKWEVDQNRALRKSGDIPEGALKQSELRYATAVEDARSAQFGVQVAEHQLIQARVALVHTQDAGQGDALPLKSPVSGKVLRVMAESAQSVMPGAHLLEIGDTNSLEIVADLLSTDAVRLEVGARTSVEHWGGVRALAAKVRRVEPSGYTKISALGVEEQRVNVLLDFDEPKENLAALGDQFRVEVRIVIWHRPDALKVPASALFRKGAGWALFLVLDGRAVLQGVEVGRRNGAEAEIIRGVEENATVIVHPADNVVDGARVSTP
jgi:HlyD family secretion protein